MRISVINTGHVVVLELLNNKECVCVCVCVCAWYVCVCVRATLNHYSLSALLRNGLHLTRASNATNKVSYLLLTFESSQ